MNSLSEQFERIEAGAARLREKHEDMLVEPVLITRLMLMLSREFNSMLDQRLRPYGINDVEFRVLLWLHSFPNECASPGVLGNKLGHSPANITRLADILLERGLISREADEQDRRRLILRLTPAGDAAIRQLLPTMTANLRAIYGGMPAAELQQLLTSLKHVMQALDKHTAAAPAAEDKHE